MVMSTGLDSGKNNDNNNDAASCDNFSISIQKKPSYLQQERTKVRRSLELKVADGYAVDEEQSYVGEEPPAKGSHQRAAVEFVMELAGKHTVPVADKIAGCQSLLHADEIPVPMFSVDLDMRCVLWNKRAEQISGWSESEIFAMPKFHNTIFSSNSGSSSTEEIVKGAFDGLHDRSSRSSQEVWNMRTKWGGQELKVVVVASPRTDAKGVSGALCVIMPLAATTGSPPLGAASAHCNVEVSSQVDLEEDQCLSDDGVDQFLSALDSPLSERGANSMEIFAAQRSIFAETERGEGTSVCSQDWCKSESASQSVVAQESAGFTRARVMVVDSRQRGRKSLTLLLERCGFEVSCACSATEALWRFEQSLQDPEGFSMVFLSLSLARAENYELVHELRCMEQQADCLPTPALIVAVTDLDRWDISNTDGLKKKDMAAGVDEVITCPSRVQQLRDTLTTLGVPIDHLDYNRSPRAVFSSWNNTPVLAR